MIISTLKKFLPFLISIVVALILSLVLLDTFSKSISDIPLWFILFTGVALLLISFAKKSRGWFILSIVIVLGLAVVIDMVFVGHILPASFIQPGIYDISQQYIDAVVANDIDNAIALTNGSSSCQEQMRATFNLVEKEIEERHGAGWRDQNLDDVIVSSVHVILEPERNELISIMVFKAGENFNSTPYIITSLRANYPLVGKRYTCGSGLILQ